MDKRALRMIPRPEPIARTGEPLKKNDRMIYTENFEIAGVPHLVINIYLQKQKATDMVCEKRVFFNADDYITQDLTTPMTKWLTGAITHDWEFMNQHHKIFASPKDRAQLAEFFRGYKAEAKPWRTDPTIWDDIDLYVDVILDERAADTHRKIEEAIDRKMEPIKDPPPAFKEWVQTDALRSSQYIFYQKTPKKDVITCNCSVCNQTFEAKRKEIGAANNAMGECPKCGASVTFKAYGRLPRHMQDIIHATYIDPTEDGYVARFFLTAREYFKENGGVRVENYFGEVVREFITYQERKNYGREGPYLYGYNETYQYTKFPWTKTGEMRWCTDRGSYQSNIYACYRSCLYPGNLPEAWAHTPMKNSGLEVLSRNTPGKPTRYWDVMKEPFTYRAIEILAKSGFYRMALNRVLHFYGGWGQGQGLNLQGTDLKSVLRMNEKGDPKKGGVPNRLNIKILRSIDATERELVLMQEFQKRRINVTANELVRFLSIFGINHLLLEPRFLRASVHKMCKYIEDVQKKDKRRKLDNIGTDWCDYLKWCDELHINLADPYHYFPPNFYAEHDRVAQLKKEHDDRIAAEQKRLREEAAKKAMELTAAAMKEIFQKNEGVDAFSIQGRGLVIIVPKNAEEIKAEGEALHHCVATYIGSVAKGETNIFFVRKAKEPNKSYFTMEWKNGKVKQCRGNRNCDMPPAVQAFVQVFEKKMQEAEKAKKKEIEGRAS